MRTRTPSRRPSHRALILGAALAVVAAAGCTEDRPPPVPPGARTLEEMAREAGADVVEHLRRGYYAGRSVDIAFVPRPHNVVVRWSGRGLGTDAADPRTSHSTPWDYHQRVPIILYGPGFVRSGATSSRSVDVTDLAPTFADLLDFRFDAPDGSTLREALLPPARWDGVPRAIVLVVYDGGGWNLLEEWPSAWPVERRLARSGTLYTNATIGSAPSVTTAIHANMGTGAYPATHGMPEITARLPDGSVGDIYFERADPRLLEAPTVGDLWDLERENEPWVGMIGYESWHLGMMSHGAQAPGGDRDASVLWEREPGLGGFYANEEFYDLPPYLPGDAELRKRLRELDGEDGAIDGSWMGHDLADPEIVPGTPAFVRHQGQALLEMLRRERVGEDQLTDLVFVELKPTDFGGHIWNMVAPEEEFVLRAQDELLGELVRDLDRRVGRGRYVLMLTADHGQTPIPESTGGRRIHPDVVGARVDERYGITMVQKVTPSGIFLRPGALEEAGVTLEQVARFVGDLRYGDGLPPDADRSRIPPQALRERVFAAALPGPYLGGLTDAVVAALGPGEYPEGDLTSAQPARRFERLVSG
ncbi:MAG TPA: alkaline phosphatase family protein [Actinomycetota bacterium]|nr:alkaline phosphatase family protein [Actinomycetota bacterium]